MTEPMWSGGGPDQNLRAWVSCTVDHFGGPCDWDTPPTPARTGLQRRLALLRLRLRVMLWRLIHGHKPPQRVPMSHFDGGHLIPDAYLDEFVYGRDPSQDVGDYGDLR